MGSQSKSQKILTIALLVLLLIATGLMVTFLLNQGVKHDPEKSAQEQSQTKESEDKAEVSSLIKYELPEGWTTISCDSGAIVLIVPTKKVSPACTTLADSWPMKFVTDVQRITDCNKITVNNQQITNHVCSSQNINGTKVLVASTTYNSKSSFGKDTKVSDYYVKTSKSVVKLEYADDLVSAEDNYQAEFDKIANSIKVN